VRQALLDGAWERPPHGAAADAELAGDHTPAQGPAGREPAGDDPRSQLSGDPLRRGVPPQRLEHVPHAHRPTMLGGRMWGSGRRRAGDRRTLCLLTPGAISRPTVDILTTWKIACQAGERVGPASSRWGSPSWS